MISQEYSSAIVILLVTILPMFGVKIGTVELTNIVQAAITVIAGIWIIVRRYKQGNITTLGVRK